MKFRSITVISFLILSTVAMASRASDIDLVLQEPVGASRINDNVTGGIPLPVGSTIDEWSLHEGNREIPMQLTPMPGTAGNWALLDFQADLGAFAEKRLVLRRVAPTAVHASPVTISETVDSVTVDTGVLRATISKRDFDFFESVEIGGTTLTNVPGPNMTVIDASSNNAYVADASNAIFTWEDIGPIRSTLRVDGGFTGQNGDWAGVGYTFRLSFYAGSGEVKIDYRLRNSLSSNERHIKIRSATVRVGNGDNHVRSSKLGEAIWTSMDQTGLTIELMPTDHYAPSDANGGMIIPDLSHFRGAVVIDFIGSGNANQQQLAANNPLHPRADSSWYAEHGFLSAERFGSLEDERNANRQWGWTWNPATDEPIDQLATGTNLAIPGYYLSWRNVDVHGDTESDDSWQHLIMYLRTGQRSYWDRARAWARYMADEYTYRTDGFDYAWDGNYEASSERKARPKINIPLTSADSSYLGDILNHSAAGRIDVRYDDFGGDHLWGWGLIDYYYLTGDRAALDAAQDIAEISERIFSHRAPGSYSMGGVGMRQGARHLLFVSRLYQATSDPRWQAHMQHLAELWLQSPDWDSRGMYEITRISPVHVGFLDHALWLYWQVSGDPRARQRLIDIANWTARYALHEITLQSGSRIEMDNFAQGRGPEGIWHRYFDEGSSFCDPVYTVSFVDTLVRGYRLTNDRTLLERAKLHWEQGSKADYGTCASIASPTEVGRFQNEFFLFGGIRQYYYHNTGDLSYAHLLFAEYGQPSSERPAPPTALRVE